MKSRFWIWYIPLTVMVGCQQSIPTDVSDHLRELDHSLSYNNDVLPVLSDRCFSCHGPDANTRKAELRLDIKPSDAILAVVMDRVLSENPEDFMPPPESKMTLSSQEKAILVKWIRSGAKYEEHWAFTKPSKAEPPALSEGYMAANEVDNFITQTLAQEKIPQSPIANKERLLRRVTLDITGLPPTIEEMDAFLTDESEQAYEKVVDRLLASKEYGERMAMEWMDVARYADSHGMHADGYRMMWPWRDWVIQAFSDNMSYKDFVTWQLAGDLMPDATYEQKLATAFNRNHTMTAEGGAIDEEFRLSYVYDRTETFSTVFLGLTTGCARCHDHKFDPISQKEFYELAAYFNNVKELGMTGDDGNYGPMLPVLSEVAAQEIRSLEAEINELSHNEVYKIKDFVDLAETQPFFHGNIDKLNGNVLDGIPNFTSRAKSELVEGFSGKAAFITGEYDELYISDIESFGANDPFAVSMYINTTKKKKNETQTLIGTTGNKNEFWRGWDFYLDEGSRLNVRLVHTLPHNYIHARSSEVVDTGIWKKVMFSYDGSAKAGGIKFNIDDENIPAEVVFDHLYKSIKPVTSASHLPMKSKAIMVGKSYRAFTGEYGVFKGRVDDIKIYKFPKEDELRNKVKEKIERYSDVDEVMVMEEMPSPRKAFMYNRGEYDQPSQEVFAATPAVLHTNKDTSRRDRLALTEWLFSDDNPLTARVTVNRYWQMIFGEGLVSSTNDFGLQGSRPSHPELLDYLSIGFMESGWDVKWLIRKLVNSHTYKQSSKNNAELLEMDPKNKLLARGPSIRMQAEMIRDNALAASGLLKKGVGGESVRPYQPEGLWIEKSSFSHMLLNYEPDKGDSLYRRSLYTFIRRTSPNPSMTIFDAPNREVCTVKRENTSTPLQALVLLNDPQFVEISRIMAERIQVEGGRALESQIQYAFRLATGRTADEKELDLLKELYENQLAYYAANEEEAKELISVGEFRVAEDMDIASTAALSVVSSTLINHNESYTKR